VVTLAARVTAAVAAKRFTGGAPVFNVAVNTIA
jgi:hypothetical protein